MKYKVKVLRPIVWPGIDMHQGQVIKLGLDDTLRAQRDGWGELCGGQTLEQDLKDQEIPPPPAVARNPLLTMKGRMASPGKVVCSHVVKPDSRTPGEGEVLLEICETCAASLRGQSGHNYRVKKYASVSIQGDLGSEVGQEFYLSASAALQAFANGWAKLCRNQEFFWAEQQLAKRKDWLCD